MNGVYNRKMFRVQGARAGSQLRSEPEGARPESVFDGSFLQAFPIDITQGVVGGFEEGKKQFEYGVQNPSAKYPYLTKGFLTGIADSFKGTPDKLATYYNAFIAPITDITKPAGIFAINELAIGTGIIPRDKRVEGGGSFDVGSSFRFRTEANPYGFPDQFGTTPASYFMENFPPGSAQRASFLLEAIRQPNFANDLAKIGVSRAEIAAAENELVNKFYEGRERGLNPDLLEERGFDPEVVKEIYDFPEEKPEQPFRDVPTGDLSLMESIAREGPFPQPQPDLGRGSESPFKVDKRTKDLIKLLGGDDAAEVPDGTEQDAEKAEVLNNSGETQNDFQTKTEKQAEIAAQEAEGFDFEKETERFKKLLTEATKTNDTTTPALLLLQLASNLVSGKTNEKGFAGFLDVLGQASGPVLDSAVKLASDKKALEREIGATAVSMAFEKEKDILDRAATLASEAAKQNETFDTTKYAQRVKRDLAGNIIETTDEFVDVNSRPAFNALNSDLVPMIDPATGVSFLAPGYILVDSKQEPPFYAGLIDDKNFFTKGQNDVMNQTLDTIGFIQYVKGGVVDENGKALVGPKALLDLSLAKGVDFIQALTNNVDTKFLYNDQEAADMELAFSQIDASGLNDDQKIVAKQNLLLKSQGEDYYDTKLIQLLNEEIFTADAFGGFTIDQIRKDPDAVRKYMDQNNFTKDSTLPVKDEFGETKYVPIGDVVARANETFETLVQAAAEEGIEYREGVGFVRPERKGQKYSFTIGGKRFDIDPSVFQLGLKSKILGIQFARFQQPKQRLLKDTIQTSIGEFNLGKITAGPQEIYNKLTLFEERAIEKYNRLVRQNFKTEYFDMYKYTPNKVDVFSTPNVAGNSFENVILATQADLIQGGTNKFSESEVQSHNIQQTGQNFSEKVKIMNLSDIMERYGVDF